VVAPPAVHDDLRKVAGQLRQARTDEGLALVAGEPAGAGQSAERAAALAATLEELEASHRQREQWRRATSRLQAQATAAEAELAARAETRVAGPLWDMDLDTLRVQVQIAERRVQTATEVGDWHETVGHQWQHEADRLAKELARLDAERPEVTAAQCTVRAERLAADRIDQLETLDRRRLRWPVLRSGAGDELHSELRRLLGQYPDLHPGPAFREECWAGILRQAQAAEQQHFNGVSRQIDEAVDHIDEHTAIARRARGAAQERGEVYGRLSAELARRTAPPEQPAEKSGSPGNSTDPWSQATRLGHDETPAATVSGRRPRVAPDAPLAVRHQQRQPESDSPAARPIVDG
jgi:hypothetical protein